MNENIESGSTNNDCGSLDTTISNEQVTPQKGFKRKHLDEDLHEKIKGFSEEPDNSPKTPDPSSSTPEKPCSTRKRMHIDPEELHNVLGGMEEEIDDALEKAALKNRLSRMNVKNILRHVITNEYVLSMVRNTMKIESGEKELEDAVFEPKLTRSKAKQLRQTIPWPVPSPMKKGDEVTQLLEKEFNEESSDDEDYKPNEEEEHSDDDYTIASPRTSELFSPRTPASEISSPPEPSSAPIEKVLEHYAEDENALVIELPDLNQSSEISEADKIALRTRSKLKLTDTPLEEIEASFFAPDITVDMYDTYCDDEEWKKFLADLSRPIDSKVIKEDVEEANDVEDTDDDPEFFVQEEEEESPDPLDLAYDQTTKISRAELNALFSEIIEYAQQEYMDAEDEEEEDNKNSSQIFESVFNSSSDACIETRSEWMNADEKLQLDEQMRMYIQLLTQVYLLSHGSPDLQNLNNSIKLYLGEIEMFASRKFGGGQRSAFNAHNLEDALKIIDKFEKSDVSLAPQQRETNNPKCVPVPVVAKRTLATSKVFIYPELLPIFGLSKPYVSRKAQFCAAEDNLIAIGLEQFSSCNSTTLDMIHKWILPCKSVSQLKIRLKACKSPKVTTENPVKYFLVHKVAPPYQRVVHIFDPDQLKTPAEYPLEVLPKWMTYYNRIASGHPMFVPPPSIAPAPSNQSCPPSVSPRPIAPVPSTQPSSASVPPVAVVRPMFRKVPEKKKSRLILPHGAVFSPLKQVTPFLKKYSSYPKKTITVLPFTVPNPSKPKCNYIANKTGNFIVQKSDVTSLRTIKPKPVMETDNNAVSSSETQTSFTTTDSNGCSETSLIQTQNVNESLSNQPVKTSMNLNNKLNTMERGVEVGITDKVFENSSSGENTEQQNESETTPGSPLSAPSTLDSHLTCDGKIRPTPKLLSKSGNETSVSNIEIDMDEGLEEDEHDSPTVAAVVSKKQTSSKKRNRVQKDLESSLELLKPSMISNDPKKEEREILYVNSYLLRAAETLKNDPDTWNLFLMSICKYQQSSTFPYKLYLELKEILKNYPALLDDFVAFLKPAEAKVVGKFKQFLMLTKIRDFLRKVEVHFSNQPHHIPRIVRALSQFRQQSYVTSAEALSGLLPLLRNQTHLVEELTQLIPDAAPPVYLQTDFEDLAFPNSDEDVSSNGSCENITIPDTPDPYGGKECPCNCHSNSTDNKMLNRSRHCVKCGVKFMDGRIYLQTGKVLKPAQVTYRELPSESNGKEAIQKNNLKQVLSHEMILKALTNSQAAAKLEAAALKKDIAKAVNVNSKPVNASEALPSCSKLPCDVIEDTVFPTVANTSNKSTPSDFSLLRNMIQSTKENTSSQLEADDKQLSIQKKKWSGDEDKLIIYNCQRLGIRKETFSVTAKSLKERTAEEVEERFLMMVEKMSKNTQNQQA